jgi:hypothetical protein
VAKDARTEVIFPEKIFGGLPPTKMAPKPGETPMDGILVTRSPNLDRVFLLPTMANYNGTMTVTGDSGKSYILYMVSDQTPDISVAIREGDPSGQEPPPQSGANRYKKKLIEWMMRGGKVPPGYQHNVLKGPIKPRIVYRQGAVILYLTETYESPKRKGFVMIAENTGPTPVYFPVESIDLRSREIRKTFGVVDEISIDNPRLGPHPEYSSGVLDSPNQSFLYLATRKP